MVEYILGFLTLFVVVMSVFLIYDRYLRTEKKKDSQLYVEALRDLLDGRQESAFGKLRQVVAEDSTNLDAYLRLGKILRDNKQPQRALQVHKDLTIRGGLSPASKYEILRQLYYDYYALKDFDMAEAALKEAATLKIGGNWVYSNLLKLQQETQKWEEAYESAVALLKLDSNKSKKPLAGFKYQMGMKLFRQREYHKARVLFKEALGLDPTLVEAYLAIGDSYANENRREDAVNFWNKLIETVPGEGHQAIERLQKSLFDLGRFGDIAEICEQILVHFPDNRAARLTLAHFHEKKGEIDTAINIMTQLVDQFSDDAVLVLELMRMHLETGDINRLSESVRLLLKRNENIVAARKSSNPVSPVGSS
ncbi:MAG: tetratricopeptide repeat protein [bacterium]|nr:tetratricopeptide repeat protein [bacterium]